MSAADVEALLCLCHEVSCPVHDEHAGPIGEYDVASLMAAIAVHERAVLDATLAHFVALADELTELTVQQWRAYIDGPGGKTEALRQGKYEATDEAKGRLCAAIRNARDGAA